MTLIAWNVTGPILKNGAIGTEQACCCTSDPPPTACSCSGSPVTVPRSVSLEVSLGALLFSSGTCTQADVEAFIEGTYSLPFSFSDTLGAYYKTTLSSGVEVGFDWYCSTLSPNANAAFGFSYCDGSKTCISRYVSVYYFGVPGGTFWPANIPALCDVTTGDTTAYSTTYGDPKSFEQGPLDCASGANAGRRRYDMNVTVTPSW
jgi:hypothetical protein